VREWEEDVCNVAVSRQMSLLSSGWECKEEQDFMPYREITKSRLLFGPYYC